MAYIILFRIAAAAESPALEWRIISVAHNSDGGGFFMNLSRI
jgi:hypothetical protein